MLLLSCVCKYVLYVGVWHLLSSSFIEIVSNGTHRTEDQSDVTALFIFNISTTLMSFFHDISGLERGSSVDIVLCLSPMNSEEQIQSIHLRKKAGRSNMTKNIHLEYLIEKLTNTFHKKHFLWLKSYTLIIIDLHHQYLQIEVKKMSKDLLLRVRFCTSNLAIFIR